MNDQQILTLIAKKPGIVAIQIADALDVELSEASAALKELVEIGHVQRSTGTAPNGLAAQVYHLTEEFKRTNEYRAVMAAIEAEAPRAAAPVAAPAPVPAPAASAAIAAVAPVSTPTVGRAERAIAFIRTHGPVTDAQLRAELGMKLEEYPSTVLSHAVKAGRVARVGSEWLPGAGAPPAPVKKQPAFGGSLGLPGSSPRAPVAVPRFADFAVAAAPTASPAPIVDQAPAAEPPKFRCGLWSDGVLELQRDGIQVAALTQHEGEALAGFMARLREPLEKVA